MVNSRRKGARGELEAAKAWEDAGLGSAYRGQQYSGIEGRDIVIEIPGVHVEVKRTEAISVYKAMDQAVRDAGNDDTPIVLHRRNRQGWLCICKLEDLPMLASKIVRNT